MGKPDVSFLPRMGAAFFPLMISWFFLAPALGLFQKQTVIKTKKSLASSLAMIFAALIRCRLTRTILNAPIIPIFALVLGATSALGMLVWRGIYLFLNVKKLQTARNNLAVWRSYANRLLQ